MKKILSGKVREVYDIGGDRLVIVATDRISAFDVILGSTIKNKGVALTKISNFWFDFTKDILPNHLLCTKLSQLPPPFSREPEQYEGRTVLVKKLRMLPYEFIVRGYLFGSMWKEYEKTGAFCGQKIPGQHQMAEKLPAPVVTPVAKNSEGHDENISLERLRQELGAEEADRLCEISLRLYEACAAHALKNGILIADTKFEFGYDKDGVLALGDEIFTPDSSRFWAAEEYQVGVSPKSYDKQFVRDWLTSHGLDGVTPGAALPEEIVAETEKIYKECYSKITGEAENL